MKILKTILLLTVALLFLPATLSAKPRDLGAFSNVRTSSARMPFYKDRTLEYFLRSRSMAMRGRLLDAAWPMIDSVRKGISVESAHNKSVMGKLLNIGTKITYIFGNDI